MEWMGVRYYTVLRFRGGMVECLNVARKPRRLGYSERL